MRSRLSFTGVGLAVILLIAGLIARQTKLFAPASLEPIHIAFAGNSVAELNARPLKALQLFVEQIWQQLNEAGIQYAMPPQEGQALELPATLQEPTGDGVGPAPTPSADKTDVALDRPAAGDA